MTDRCEALPDDAPHVLIVDDDQKICDLLARYLFSQGFRATTAGDTITARSAMRGLAFDVVPARCHDAGRKRARSRPRAEGDAADPDLHVDRSVPSPSIASKVSKPGSTITSPSHSSRGNCCSLRLLQYPAARATAGGGAGRGADGRLRVPHCARGAEARRGEHQADRARARSPALVRAASRDCRSRGTSCRATTPPAASAPSTCRSTG